AIKWQLVPEHHFPTEVLEIRVLHPSLAQRLVGEVVHMLENEQPGYQPRRQRRLPRSHPTHRAEASRPKVPIDLPEIAPELTGHGLPLSKCEAYNRVYDQFYQSR